MNAKKLKIAPSLLSADFARLKDEIEMVAEAGADLLHIDVMDGHFVPNITIGPCVVASIKKCSSLPLDVHLMISEPGKYMQAFAEAGSDFITFHIEVEDDPRRLIEKARALGTKPGISLRPRTPIAQIEPWLADLDLVLVMSVEPGFGGQKFMKESLDRVAALKKHARCPQISIDGGINLETAPLAVAAGVDILVAGSAIFQSPSPKDTIQAFQNMR